MFGNKACSLFSKLIFSNNSSQGYHHWSIRVSNSLEQEQALQLATPDLCPNCLQRLSADKKSCHMQAKHMDKIWA